MEEEEEEEEAFKRGDTNNRKEEVTYSFRTGGGREEAASAKEEGVLGLLLALELRGEGGKEEEKSALELLINAMPRQKRGKEGGGGGRRRGGEQRLTHVCEFLEPGFLPRSLSLSRSPSCCFFVRELCGPWRGRRKRRREEEGGFALATWNYTLERGGGVRACCTRSSLVLGTWPGPPPSTLMNCWRGREGERGGKNRAKKGRGQNCPWGQMWPPLLLAEFL